MTASDAGLAGRRVGYSSSMGASYNDDDDNLHRHCLYIATMIGVIIISLMDDWCCARSSGDSEDEE